MSRIVLIASPTDGPASSATTKAAEVEAQVHTCSIQLEDGEPCGKAVFPAAPVPVCGDHAESIYRFVRSLLGVAASESPGPRKPHRLLAPIFNDQEVVYYMLVGDRIKIGWSSNFNDRRRDYPPGSRLLALEPGNRALETRRHKQFKIYRANLVEWFWPGPLLMEHIEELHGLHAPRRPTLTGPERGMLRLAAAIVDQTGQDCR